MRANMSTLLGSGLGLTLLVVCTLSLSAQGGGRGGPPPLSTALFDQWTPDQLSKPGNLGNYGNHAASVQRRDVGAAPEIHDGFSHILMFTSGEGTFILGGEIVDGPDGKKMIRAGETHKIAPGVVWHIPMKVAHQVVPNPGSSVTYFVTNINVDKP